jgi:hypothetical protein
MGFPVNAPVKHHDTNCRCRKCSSWCPEVCFNHGISLQTHPMIHMPDRRCVFGLPISRQFFIIFGGSSLSCLSIYLHRPCVDRVPRWSVIIHIYIHVYIYICPYNIYMVFIYIWLSYIEVKIVCRKHPGDKQGWACVRGRARVPKAPRQLW